MGVVDAVDGVLGRGVHVELDESVSKTVPRECAAAGCSGAGIERCSLDLGHGELNGGVAGDLAKRGRGIRGEGFDIDCWLEVDGALRLAVAVRELEAPEPRAGMSIPGPLDEGPGLGGPHRHGVVDVLGLAGDHVAVAGAVADGEGRLEDLAGGGGRLVGAYPALALVLGAHPGGGVAARDEALWEDFHAAAAHTAGLRGGEAGEE
mmetsp:Transcript_11039/g.27809  ORF Transcript_11039/g.27809 Transcript_11039/m.27809 type:complete len:206 (+) Transcript_11039:702-1319(+)